MIEVELPNGDIAEFPDGMSQDQITAVLQRQFDPVEQLRQQIISEQGPSIEQQRAEALGAPVIPPAELVSSPRLDFERLKQSNPELAQIIGSLGPVEAAAVGFQQGLRTVARGAGKAVGADLFPELRDPALTELSKISPLAATAKIVGEVAPFAAISPFAALPRTIAGRAAAGGALGGTEASLITAGEDLPAEAVSLSAGLGLFLGGVSEALIPVISRAFRKRADSVGITGEVLTPDGQLTQEAAQQLASKGLGKKKFIRQAVNDADVSKAQRQSLLQDIDEPKLPETGLPATRGEVLQSQKSQEAFDQLKIEQQLIEQSGEAGDRLRALKLRQSDETSKMLQDLSPGDAELVGPAIKEAIELRESSARFARKQAYDNLAEVTQDLDVGLSMRSVSDALPDAGEAADFSGTFPGQSKTLNNLLAEFGIVAPPANFAREVTPVSVSNFERLRKRLGTIEDSDVTGNTSRIIGPIRRALDDEFELAARSLESLGQENVAQAAKRARLSHAALKTEFDKKGLVDQLIAPKARGSSIPKIEDSQVYSKLLAQSTPVEQFSSVIRSLDRAASKGVLAKNQLKSRMVMDLLDSGFHAKTRKIQGQPVFGANAFLNRFNTIKPKLKKIMTPSEMQKLNALAKDMRDIVPPSGAVPKGSAGFFIDALDKIGVWSLLDKIPGAGAILSDQIKKLGRAAKDERLVSKALQAPASKEAVQLISSDFPALGAALLPGIVLAEEDQ